MKKLAELPNIVKIIIIVAILLLITAICVAITIIGNKREQNPVGTIGNTAGNLFNSGYFVEDEDVVYFANSYDSNSLYKMNPDETEIQKLYSLKVRNLLAAGKYLYAFEMGSTVSSEYQNMVSSTGFMRFTKDKDETFSFLKGTVVSAQLVDNSIYFEMVGSGLISFKKVSLDKSKEVELADYAIDPACASNSTIFFSGTTQDHYLYSLNTTTDNVQVVYGGEVWYPTYYNGYIFFLNVADNYKLCRINLADSTVETLTQDRVDCFNIGSGFIYYQKNSKTEPALKGMRYDGTDPFTIMEGNYTSINITSRYVYFAEFGNDIKTYHCPIGTANVSEFVAARNAVE